MDKKKALAVLAVIFVVLIGGASFLYMRLGKNMAPDQLAVETGAGEMVTEPDSQDEAKEGNKEEEQRPKLPDFTVYDKDGNEAHLSDYIGKPVVLNFWASWCGPCKMEMPEFQKKYDELGEKIHFLMVNMTDGSRETKETASRLIEKQEYTFPVFFDTEFQAATAFQVYSLPTTYFIDEEGYGIAQATGAIDGETLQRGIDMILEKE